MDVERFLRLKQVCEVTALSKSEIYRRVQAGKFPKQVRISHNLAVWKQSDISKWMEQVLDVA